MKYTEAQINKLLRGVYDGVLDTQKLPENLYYAIAEHLEKGLCKGFGGTVAQFDAKPTLLINSMRENLYMFSGAKVYQQTSEMVAALQSLNRNLIKEDRLATFKEFKQDALQVYQKYNVNWLKTEYDTAIASGQMGERWAQIQEDSDILPYLTMSVIEDATTTEICAPLDKITLPINDVFWAKYYPPNHWNCRSTVLQTDDKTKLSSKKQIKHATDHAKKDVPEVFQMNVGKDGMVFSEKHPYFDVPKYDREFAANNFGLPFPKFLSKYEMEENVAKNVEKLIAEEKLDTERLYSANGSYLKDRLEFQEKLVENYIANGSTNEGTSYFMGGAPATGKSSILEKDVVKLPDGILVLDSDKIKAQMPEYVELVNRKQKLAASKVHEESSKISKDIAATIADRKLDIHLDGVNDGSYEDVLKKIAQQRSAGKRCEAHYVTTNVETSVERATARAIKTGRDVPEPYIRKMHKEISNLVPKLAENGDFDALYLYDNNGSKDSKPLLIFSQIGKKITVHDKAKYAAFLKQGR